MTDSNVDTLTSPAMASWLRETAANTRRHSNPSWCDAHLKPHDPLAAHVAFRMEQAAELVEQLSAPQFNFEELSIFMDALCTHIDHLKKLPLVEGRYERIEEILKLKQKVASTAGFPIARRANP